MNRTTTKTTTAPVDETDAAWEAIETALLGAVIDAQQALDRAFPPSKPVPRYRKTVKRLRDMRRKVRSLDAALLAIEGLRETSPAPEVKPAQIPQPLAKNGNGHAAEPRLF